MKASNWYLALAFPFIILPFCAVHAAGGWPSDAESTSDPADNQFINNDVPSEKDVSPSTSRATSKKLPKEEFALISGVWLSERDPPEKLYFTKNFVDHTVAGVAQNNDDSSSSKQPTNANWFIKECQRNVSPEKVKLDGKYLLPLLQYKRGDDKTIEQTISFSVHNITKNTLTSYSILNYIKVIYALENSVALSPPTTFEGSGLTKRIWELNHHDIIITSTVNLDKVTMTIMELVRIEMRNKKNFGRGQLAQSIARSIGTMLMRVFQKKYIAVIVYIMVHRDIQNRDLLPIKQRRKLEP